MSDHADKFCAYCGRLIEFHTLSDGTRVQCPEHPDDLPDETTQAS